MEKNTKTQTDVILEQIRDLMKRQTEANAAQYNDINELTNVLQKNNIKDILAAEKRKYDPFGKALSKRNSSLSALFRNITRALDEKQTQAKFLKLNKGMTPETAKELTKKVINQTGFGTSVTGKFLGFLSKASAFLSVFNIAIQGVNSALMWLGERSKYYKSAIAFSNNNLGFTNVKGLFKESTAILQATRDFNKLGTFIGNEKFVSGFRTLLESGVLAKAPINELLESYKYIASQGILLGNTFEETAQDLSQVASIYNLKATKENSIESYKYISRAIEIGMQAGLTKSNVVNYLLQYSKSTATSSIGFTTVLGDLLTTINVIKDTSGQQRQQYMSTLQSLAANKMPFTSYLGLVERGQRYAKSAFNGDKGLVKKYWQASSLQSNVEAFKYLSRTKGIGDELTLQLGSQLGLFQGLDNEIGLDVMKKLISNKSKYNAFMNLKDKSAAGQAKWLAENYGYSADQRLKIEQAAQLSEALSDPMKTIINILQTMVRYIATIATSSIFGNVLSLDTAMMKDNASLAQKRLGKN